LANRQQFLKIARHGVDTSLDTQTATGNGTSIMTNHVELSTQHCERQHGDRQRPYQDQHRYQIRIQHQDQKGQR
jgi:hypothetical protein